MNYRSIFIIFIALLMPFVLFSQQGGINYLVKNGFVEIEISRSISQDNLDSILSTCGTTIEGIDTARVLGTEFITRLGWKLQHIDNDQIILLKKLSDMKGKLENTDFLFLDAEEKKGLKKGELDITIGKNRFKKTFVKNVADEVTFFLAGNNDANEVFISGSFNEWGTSSLPMKRVENGWQIKLYLSPGKYLYKYIVDGEWKEDKNNLLTEENEHGTKNNVYFKSNYTFKLKGFEQAKRVYLSGSFNDWNERSLSMIKKADGWELPVFLREGTYTYKFIVDGDWIVDPNNSDQRDDGSGNINSVLSLGDQYKFELQGYENANEVVVCGSFNNWNEYELKLDRKNDSWAIPYVLPAGIYEYKYKIDHEWINDPYNQIYIGEGDYKNSILVIKPNKRFYLSGYPDAKKVILSGSFNGWNETGYTMLKENDEWVLDLHLSPGKYTYKFIVDGEWIDDPQNNLWENNEFEGRNSVIWITP